jgi:hypothetical protein
MARLTFDFNRCSGVTMTESGSLWVARLLRTKAVYRSLQQRMEQEESELFVLPGGRAQELCSLLVRADQRLP